MDQQMTENTQTADGASGPDARPVLRIVHGNPDAAQIAAIVAVLSAAGGDEEAAGPRRITQWSSPERAVRAPAHPSRGAWRTSAWAR
ncbi:hypothetical protein BN11_480017 [Nostocoides australiense Ben110]|uniref:Uncharacterized protein n=2 Tax=Nostocoides australiense TaxID=99480 RepID=W6K131_9MICO|nr:hypothetical protein BN11_480017 [Tetrasphaera australiensis Ben110]